MQQLNLDFEGFTLLSEEELQQAYDKARNEYQCLQCADRSFSTPQEIEARRKISVNMHYMAQAALANNYKLQKSTNI